MVSHNLEKVLNFSSLFEKCLTWEFKGAQSWYLELFWPHTKLPLNGRKPENNSLTR